MHFKTLVVAGLTSLAAVAGLPSGSRSHEGLMMARHHRNIRPRKAVEADPTSTKKRCGTRATSDPVPEPTDAEVENLAAKPTPTSKSNSAKFTSTSTKKTSTSTKTETDDAEPAVPTSGTGGISISDKLLAVFPGGLANGKPHWSTNPAVTGAFALSDANLNVDKSIKLAHPVVPMEGKRAMKVTYGAGGYAYKGSSPGGISLYALGPAGQSANKAKELTFSYSVYFEKGFSFVKGGKLPGLCTSDDNAASCSGGDARDDCWSLRYMWRTAGAGELYAYLPPSAKSTNKANLCSKSAGGIGCDLDYGWSIGRGSWQWKTGVWQTIAQKITLNDIGKANGVVETYLDGKKVHTVNNMVIRSQKNSMPRGAMIQSFFGGSDSSWAPKSQQTAYFADFSLAVLDTE
ncbi:hypothetical protein FRC12_018710 [Ceratobasidium sp. 428]|nr:hypothetical protein FRC12_018710 [Ceratobasidium sp. 428]